MYSPPSMNGLVNFIYIIVTPKKQDAPDSFFNRFNNSIIDSITFLETIAKLPVNLIELEEGWPLSASLYNPDTKYNILYINESSIRSEEISSFFSFIFGAVFISDGVNLETIKLIKKYTRLPIVSKLHTTYTLGYNQQLVQNLYSYWRKTTEETIISHDDEKEHRSYFQSKNLTSIKGYVSISTHFLKPLHSSINRLRGLYQDLHNGLFVPEPMRPDIYDKKEKEANEEILKAVKQLIVDKFLTLMVGYFAEGSFDRIDENILSAFGIKREDIINIYEQKDDSIYQNAAAKILNSFDKLIFKTDMVLCFPSINYHLLMRINDLGKKDRLPKKILRLFYNSSSYYYLFNPSILDGSSDKRKDFNVATFLFASSERAKELALISSLHTIYSLGKRNPFIRTRNVPSQEFYTKAYALAQYSEKMEERNKVPDFVKTFKKLTSIITKVVPDDQWEVILNNGNNIKVLSDMPVEWVNYGGLPLCVEKKVSRVPITPGNGLISHSYLLNNEYLLSKDNLSVLIVNTLNNDDRLYNLGVGLPKEVNRYLKLIKKDSIYKEVSNKGDFISVIEEIRPSILIYYGHGSYDSIEGIGKLHIGNDHITSLEIENIKHSPLITLLGACETQVLHGTHMNTASLFLGNLSVSVIGTFFPVDGLNTFSFISSLIRNLVNTLIGVAPKNLFEHWNDVILQTFRAHYLLEPIRSMEAYLVKRGLDLKKFELNTKILDDFFRISHELGIKDFVEMLRQRDYIYSVIFSKHLELENAFQSILKNNLLLPDSLFYSSLGSPEMIKIDRENSSEMTISSLHEYYRSWSN